MCSSDLKHALFENSWNGHGTTPMIEVDLSTGAKRTITIRGDGVRGTYSRPSGNAMLLSSESDTPGGGPGSYINKLERVDLTGNTQSTLPTDQLDGAGKYNGYFLQTPDGSQLVLGADKGMVVMGNDGVVARQLPMPAPSSSCKPVRWWTSSEILATCVAPGRVDMGMELWQVPVAGQTPTRLIAPDTTQVIGYQNAWKVPSGTFLENVPGCGGDGLLYRLGSDTKTTRVTVPGVDPGKTVRVVGVTGHELLLKTSGNCGARTKVLRIYDPAANTATVLPGPPGTVERAILYPTS